MSGPLYLLAALGLGLGLATVLTLLERYVVPAVGALYRRWLERRLGRRLARGEDKYADELRELEAGLAPGPARLPFSPLGRVLIGGAIFAAGLAMLPGIVPEDMRPAWARRTLDFLLIAIGLHWASGVFSTADDPHRGNRILGAVIALLGSLMLAYDLYRLQRATP